MFCFTTKGAQLSAVRPYYIPDDQADPRIANEILSILMVVFEYSAAILTTVRCIQELRLLGMPWREHKTGLYYLIFEQGTSIIYYSTAKRPHSE